ncbi:MAG: hypothetical protein LUE13_03775, partial [Akkermansiaceae bacterium]|nr:hypothetical protein [Akkermansiaceae bacterium]
KEVSSAVKVVSEATVAKEVSNAVKAALEANAVKEAFSAAKVDSANPASEADPPAVFPAEAEDVNYLLMPV